jgi:hypothetical protein
VKLFDLSYMIYCRFIGQLGDLNDIFKIKEKSNDLNIKIKNSMIKLKSHKNLITEFVFSFFFFFF